MRIIAGKYKGLRFNASVPDGVRPTSDRNREAIFNILNNLVDFDGTAIIDICAGTGAMGLEALSRGAEFCDFIEKSKRTAEYIKKNAIAMKINEADYNIINNDALKILKNNEGYQYDLAFLDPPYALNLNNAIISQLHKHDYIKPGGIIVSESAIGYGIIVPESFELISNKNYGDTKVVVLERSI